MTQPEDLFDYSRCTLAELEDVASHIDGERFPERLAEVRRLLAVRRSEPQPDPTEAPGPAKLSVGKLLIESWRFFWRAKGVIPKLSLFSVPLGGTIAYGAAAIRSGAPPDERVLHWIVYLVSSMLLLGVIATIAVPLHRMAVLSADPPMSVSPIWTPIHTRFLAWSIALASISWFVTRDSTTFSPGAAALVLVLEILAIYLAARLLPLLAATAIDEPLTLRLAWSMTHGNGARLAVAQLLAALPLMIVAVPIAVALGPDLAPGFFDWKSQALISGAVWLCMPVVVALEVGVLSHAYIELSGRSRGAPIEQNA